MKIRHPTLIRVLGFGSAWIIRALHASLRMRIDNRATPELAPDPRRTRNLYAFWHEHILSGAQLGRSRVDVLISQHADGEFIAEACRHLRFGLIRGSSRRGAQTALREMLRASRRRHIAVTPDGPRGPRRRVQPGIIYVASRLGLPVIPFTFGYENAWRVNSWDRFAVPKPFSLVTLILGSPLVVPADINEQQIEEYRLRLETAMHRLDDEAQRWAQGEPPATRLPPAALRRAA